MLLKEDVVTKAINTRSDLIVVTFSVPNPRLARLNLEVSLTSPSAPVAPSDGLGELPDMLLVTLAALGDCRGEGVLDGRCCCC